MFTIKPGEEQPLPCNTCGNKMGYHQSDLIRTSFISFYRANGNVEVATWSDGETVLNKGKTAYCNNCGAKLPFKFEY